jgi:NAD(P)-dependent dehydrogenase (short-subunit alcohol dehydrogenase family)
VVTGGGRGAGEAIARSLAEAGAAVLVTARTAAQVERVARDIEAADGRGWAATCDVTDEGSVEALAETALRTLGGVDILVNNAGVAMSSSIQATRLEDWERVFAVNVRGTFLCTRAFLPGMVERGWGRVVNIASTAGLKGDRYMAAYASSKHAVLGFTRSVAAEAARAGVTANAVCPGYLDTDMTRESIARIMQKTGRSTDEALEAILAVNPQRRLIAPAEVAAVVRLLCGAGGAGINGEAITIDGGELRR